MILPVPKKGRKLCISNRKVARGYFPVLIGPKVAGSARKVSQYKSEIAIALHQWPKIRQDKRWERCRQNESSKLPLKLWMCLWQSGGEAITWSVFWSGPFRFSPCYVRPYIYYILRWVDGAPNFVATTDSIGSLFYVFALKFVNLILHLLHLLSSGETFSPLRQSSWVSERASERAGRRHACDLF